jgi:hypothetical protein
MVGYDRFVGGATGSEEDLVPSVVETEHKHLRHAPGDVDRPLEQRTAGVIDRHRHLSAAYPTIKFQVELFRRVVWLGSVPKHIHVSMYLEDSMTSAWLVHVWLHPQDIRCEVVDIRRSCWRAVIPANQRLVPTEKTAIRESEVRERRR